MPHQKNHNGARHSGSNLREAPEEKRRDNPAREGSDDLASQAKQRADDAAGSLGGGIRSLAGSLRSRAPEGPLGSVASGVADSLEQAGQYLEREQISGLARDLNRLIRQHPLPAVLLAASLGFLVARTLPRS